MRPFLTNLRNQATENPLAAVGVGAAAVTVVTQFLRTAVSAKNARAWSKEVARRTAKDLGK